jgi:hypothetical protein
MADDQPNEQLDVETPEQVEQQPDKPEEEGGQPESPAPADQPDKQPDEPQQPEAEEVEEEEQSPEKEEQPEGISKRKAKRLEKLEGLVNRLKGDSQEKPQQPKTDAINYKDLIDAPDEVYEELQKKSEEYGSKQYQAGLEQAKSIQFHTRLEIDSPRVESKFPQFDKSSEEFNPGLANAINQWYLATVGYNSKTGKVANADVRYGEFVEGIMELADAMAGSKSAKTTENVVKQAANTGLRPDGSSVKPMNLNKAPQDMSDQELEAAIKTVMPRNDKGRFISQK